MPVSNSSGRRAQRKSSLVSRIARLFQPLGFRRLQFESLEDRRLLATVTVNDPTDTLDNPTSVTISTLGSNVSLRDAINAANNTGGTNTIVLGSGQTYDFTTADNNWYGPDALPPIESDITIVGNGSTLQHDSSLGQDTADSFRFFYVSGGISSELPLGTLTLENLTLTGGLAKGGDSFQGGGGLGAGGAILNQGNLTVSGVTLNNNAAIGGSFSTFAGNGGGGMEKTRQATTVAALAAAFRSAATAARAAAAMSAVVAVAEDLRPARAAQTAAARANSADPVTDSRTTGKAGPERRLATRVRWAETSAPAAVVIQSMAVVAASAVVVAPVSRGAAAVLVAAVVSALKMALATAAFALAAAATVVRRVRMDLAASAAETRSIGGGGGAGMGGAIFSMYGSVTVVNSTLAFNTAQGGNSQYFGELGQGGSGLGGAIFNLDGAVSLTLATIANNSVVSGHGDLGIGTADGGGIYSLAYGNDYTTGATVSSSLSFVDSIVADNLGDTSDLVSQEIDGNPNTNTGNAASDQHRAEHRSHFERGEFRHQWHGNLYINRRAHQRSRFVERDAHVQHGISGHAQSAIEQPGDGRRHAGQHIPHLLCG